MAIAFTLIETAKALIHRHGSLGFWSVSPTIKLTGRADAVDYSPEV